MYVFLDYFFIFFHTALIIFNLFGWIYQKTRKLNLITLLLTAFSWFFLGIWYGFGFCFCTEWHWLVRMKLGKTMPDSYIQFLINEITGLHINERLVDAATLSFFLIALILSVTANIRDYRKKKKEDSISR